jgi:hypothetical protein
MIDTKRFTQKKLPIRINTINRYFTNGLLFNIGPVSSGAPSTFSKT